MSYKVDGTKVQTFASLVGRLLHITLGAIGGSTIKGTVYKVKGLKNEVSVDSLIFQKRKDKAQIDEGIVKAPNSNDESASRKAKVRSKVKANKPAAAEAAPAEPVNETVDTTEGVTA